MAETVKKTVIVETVDTPETVVVVQSLTPVPPNRPRKVSSSMWGPHEIGAVAAGSLAVVMAAVAFFFWVVPSSRELETNKVEAKRLESELMLANSKYGEITDTETQVAKLVASVDDFESRFLPISTTGQTALYQRLNGLISAYGLVNTAGPDYAPLETPDTRTGQETDEARGRARFRSLYPGVYVTTTLEGSYQNLRRFIREIETGREFIIVSAVELASTDTEKKVEPSIRTITRPGDVSGTANQTGQNVTGGAVQSGASSRDQGKLHGQTVSLQIEMAAYFRRPNFVPASELE